MTKIAIIGSGPTGIYTLKGLIGAKATLSITIFDVEAEVGKGTPYQPSLNDRAMLANIASLELPPICETLVDWLRRQSEDDLQRLNVSRFNIKEREFYPRVVLGEYLQSQFEQIVSAGRAAGHSIEIRPRHRVVDIRLQQDEIQLTVRISDGETKHYAFEHVVMATGHNWPETTEIKTKYFISPWPAEILKTVDAGSVGILGTSLSAIDAVVTVATAHGAFYLDADGTLQFKGAEGSEKFEAAMMSRKGLLPEADFYCDYPYAPLQFCTNEAVDALIERGSTNLLDNIFALFKQELAACDPDYAASIGLALLDADSFASAYFAAREAADPFVWAANNLAEAKQNKINHITVQWRYAILRMHEVVARAVPHFDDDDLDRFQKKLKAVFIDDYATIPHQSIERLLALRRAGKLDILKLGSDYKIRTDDVARGAVVAFNGLVKTFDSFIDATGQASMSASDLPFPSLVDQGVVRDAQTPSGSTIISDTTEQETTRTGGLDLDAAFRPVFTENLLNNLYCAAISFLLHKLPFVQGITSARDMGEIVSKAIVSSIDGEAGPQPIVQQIIV